MAKQVINIGTTANDGTGDPLRTAFDKVNDNFTELYNDDAGDVDSVNGATGVVVLDSDDIAEGSANLYNQTHTGDVTGATALTIAADAVDGTKIADDSIDSEHYVDGSIDTAHLANDSVTHDKLEARFTAKQDIATTSGTINLDASSYGIFELTSALTGATTLNIQNIKKGQVIDILVTGAQTITFSDDFTTSAINKLAEVDYDGANNNHIQMVCIDDNDSDAILNYSIASYTADTTP